MAQTKKERNKEKQQQYINQWQKENRKRIVVLATLSEYESLRDQAERENMSITRYLINCHNEHINRTAKNATTSNEKGKRGISYNNND